MGGVRVYSLKRRRIIPPRKKTPTNPKIGFSLVTDKKQKKHISIGQLHFQRLHPDVSADYISCRATNIKFNDDGTVVGANTGLRGRSYSLFKSLSDALETVLILMEATKGDDTELRLFACEKHRDAVFTVAKLLKCSYDTVDHCFDDGVERFIQKATVFNVSRIIPIFALLCQAVKSAVLEKKRTIPIDKYDGLRKKVY